MSKEEYESKLGYAEFDDMKKYNPFFSEEQVEGKTDLEIREIFKHYYSTHLPVDLLTWMRVFEPKQNMRYKDAYWRQTTFVRDRINELICSQLDISDMNTVKVASVYTSKSIDLPVYYIYLSNYDTQIIMRNNFHDWKVSINSAYDIVGIEEFIYDEKKPIDPMNCEGFSHVSQVFGMYKDNNKKFTVELPLDNYNLYLFFYIVFKSLKFD